MRDTADELNAVPPKIETATRRFVFVADAVTNQILLDMETAWLHWGGGTEFVYENANPDKVGIVIFHLERAPYVSLELAQRLRPFYAKAGTESNVFEFDPVTKTFTRRGPDWLDSPGRIVE